MCVTRSAEPGCLVLATCALFDTRVFLVSAPCRTGVHMGAHLGLAARACHRAALAFARLLCVPSAVPACRVLCRMPASRAQWRLKDEWLAAGQAAAKAATELAAGPSSGGGQAAGERRQQQQQQQQSGEDEEEAACRAASRAACWDPAAAVQVAAGALAASPAAAVAAAGEDESEGSEAARRAQYELRHVYSAPDQAGSACSGAAGGTRGLHAGNAKRRLIGAVHMCACAARLGASASHICSEGFLLFVSC